ncbi:MAG: MFS transporter [Candidatus Bathyarchaeota archaeon]|nr:MAG: MFS transporter [Candidatus Bathyarchaeota archaeon]
MLGFTIIWIGQVISLLGTAMTGFALTIWAWQITQQATALALVGFFTFAPTLLVTPFAGALVDRWNRKFVMMLSDLAAILSTVVVLLLFLIGNLQIWHLYVTGAFSGAFGAFQFPAYSAAVTTMVSKKQYGRASGMLSTAQFASNIFAPALAAIFLSIIGVAGILAIDVFTFFVAIGALLLVHVPQPIATRAGQRGKGSIWKESVYGFRYIYERKSLLALLLVFFCINLLAPFAFTLLAPMILARTGDDAIALGMVQSAIGIGGLVGGIALSIWGGPKRRIHGILIGLILATMGMFFIGLGQNPFTWALAAFFTILVIPTINGSSQAIWQGKVAPDVQGRVFAARGMIAQIGAPVAMLLAGPLADRVFEPAMMPEGSWAPLIGWLVGTGPGAGMSLMFVIAGALGMLVGLAGYAFSAVRNVEDILSDHVVEVEH